MRAGRSLPLTLILIATGVAGCIGSGDGDDVLVAPAQLSEKLWDLLPVEEVWVTSAVDGKGLNAAVYRPDTDEPVPVFINFSPYWGDSATAEGDAFARYMIEEYVPRGYAVVLASVRGTGHSEGCFQIGGDQELMDAYDVIDHFANVEWSNGNVAAGGKSYDSTTQNGVIAKFPHPALKGVFHVSGITDMYRYNYREGVPYFNGLQFTPRYYVTQGFDEYLGVTNEAGDLSDEGPESVLRLADDVACTELPEHVLHGTGSAALGLKTDYWQERDWNRFVGDSDWDGSIFFVHGLQDWNVKPDHILPWLEALPDGVPVKTWLHQDTENSGHVYPMRADWNETMLQWLDETLKGKETSFWDGPAYEVEGTDGTWRAFDAWPPAPAEEGLPVAADGTLLAADAEALRMTGQTTVTATVTPLGTDPVLIATLWDEAPGGERTWRSEAALRILYRDGLDAPAPVVPGQALEVTASFYPHDSVLEPGHQWVVTFQDGSQKGLVILPGQLEGLTVDPASATVMAAVAPAAEGVLPEQPEESACFAC